MSKLKISGLIDDPFYKPTCLDTNHTPPSYVCIPQGKLYQHVCPTCKEVTLVRPTLTQMFSNIK